MTPPVGRAIKLAPPPRGVSLAATLQAMLGGALRQTGYAFSAFGLLFSIFFVADSELVTMVKFVGSKGGGKGQVTAVRETNASENEQTIWAVDYSYEVDGRSYRGTSYAKNPQLDPGETVQVEYLERSPERSRIAGMRMKSFGFLVALVLLFPLFGLGMVASSFRESLWRAALLRDGGLAYGRLVGKKATNTEVNEQTVYELTFRFTVEHRDDSPGFRNAAVRHSEHEVVCKTHLLHAITDETHEPVLYDAARPEKAVLLDDLPGRVRVTPEGTFAASWLRALPLLILPTLSVLFFGMAVLVALGS